MTIERERSGSGSTRSLPDDWMDGVVRLSRSFVLA